MTFFKMAAAAALLTLSPMVTLPAMAADMPTAEQCDAWFAKIDTNNDGTLGDQEDAAKYADKIDSGSQSSSDTMPSVTLVKADFLAACVKGTFGMPTT
jgi:hypothetical protein